MKFVKSIHAATAVVGAVTAPKDLIITSPSSVRNVAATIAFDAMSYYQGNLSATNSIDVGDCGGGLYWQIFPDNPNGIGYKNSVSNGGFFQLAARLARATGNETYLAWAEQVWDWTVDVGFIDAEEFHIWDGADHGENCTNINQLTFTYTTGIYLYGAAVMANYTEKPEWSQRAEKIMDGAAWFFRPPGDEATKNIMYEAACETVDKCNADMSTFKGYLSRFMWQSTIMLPSLRKRIERYLIPSAQAAAASCTGGQTGRACGMKWWQGGHDGHTGLGQQMCALETIQGLLIQGAAPPLAAEDIRTVRAMSWREKPLSATVDAAAQTTEREVFSGHVQPTERSGGGRLGVCVMPWMVVAFGTALAAWGLA